MQRSEREGVCSLRSPAASCVSVSSLDPFHFGSRRGMHGQLLFFFSSLCTLSLLSFPAQACSRDGREGTEGTQTEREKRWENTNRVSTKNRANGRKGHAALNPLVSSLVTKTFFGPLDPQAAWAQLKNVIQSTLIILPCCLCPFPGTTDAKCMEEKDSAALRFAVSYFFFLFSMSFLS